MIDPDGIIIPDQNKNTVVTINNMPDFDYMVWDYDDEKDLKKFFKAVEMEVRHSFEYKQLIQYLKDNCGMDRCAYLKVSSKDNPSVRIEVHHYPFTLYDVVEIVYKKRCYYQEVLDVQMTAKEVTILHYKLLVGLISVSKTAHELLHDGKLFLPIDNVLGRYDLFVDLYKQFCEPEQLEVLDRIKNYSTETSNLQNTDVFNTNHITFATKNSEYALPDFVRVENTMYNRIDDIKKNNYKLPTLEDYHDINRKDDIKDRKSIVQPIYFINQ